MPGSYSVHLARGKGDPVIADVEHERLVEQIAFFQDPNQASDVGVGPVHAALEVRQIGTSVRRVYQVGRNRDALGVVRLAAEAVAAHAVRLAEANLHNEWLCAVRVDELRDAGNDRLDVSGLVKDVVADAPRIPGGVFHAPVAAAVPDRSQDLRDRALVRVQIPAEVAMRQAHGAVGVGIAAGGEAGTAGRALWRGGVGVEARARGRQAVEVWGLHRRHAVGFDEAAGVVGRDDQNVRRHGASRLRRRPRSLASRRSGRCHNRRGHRQPARESDASLHQHGQHVRQRAGGAWVRSRRHQ